MAAAVETMMYVREKPWHGLGTMVQEAPTSADALRLAGLDWTIESKPVFTDSGIEIPGYRANTRSSDGKVLGIVGDRYQIVQNKDAFDFTDALIGEGVTYETAGSLLGGKKIWLLGKMPERYIAGDKFEPYICFTNMHDGNGAVKAFMTPVRVVCNNTLNMAISGAVRTWSTVHRGNVGNKLQEARMTLELADKYLVQLDETADRLANERMDEEQVRDALDKMFELPEKATDRQKQTAQDAKDEIIVCTLRPDVAQFLNTKWGFLNAVSDYVGHSEPKRKTENWQENRWNSIITVHPLLAQAAQLAGVKL